MQHEPVFPDVLTLRVPEGLRERVQEVARQRGMLPSEYWRAAIRQALDADEARAA